MLYYIDIGNHNCDSAWGSLENWLILASGPSATGQKVNKYVNNEMSYLFFF